MQKIRKGDTVKVIAGKDKGKTGNVLRVIPELDKVIVEGVQVAKKHVRPNPQAGIKGGIVDKELPIHISNVAILNPETGKADRVAIRIEGQGKEAKKIRVFKSTKKDVVENNLKQ